MTRKEFVKVYGISVSYDSKAWSEMLRLEKEDALTPYNYCNALIKDVYIAHRSGMSVRGIGKWKNGNDRDQFLYSAVREKCIACMVLEMKK